MIHNFKLVIGLILGLSVFVMFPSDLHCNLKRQTEKTQSLKAAPQVEDGSGIQLLNYDPIVINTNMSTGRIFTLFGRLCNQRQIRCFNGKRFGRRNMDWNVCGAKALVPVQPCVVYSIGVNYDWSFDEHYQKAYNCTIRTFDPSMGKTAEHEHKPRIYFYPIGLSDKEEVHPTRGWNMSSFRGLLRRFHEEEKIIPFLKFDVETYEWRVLANILQDGSLNNVMQLAFELHVDKINKIHWYFELIKGLEKIGFLRWHASQKHGRYRYQHDQVYINRNFL